MGKERERERERGREREREREGEREREREGERERERERTQKCLTPNAFANYLSLACSSRVSPTVKELGAAFMGASKFVGTGLSKWDTSSVIDLKDTFNNADSMNENLGGWSVVKGE